MSAEQLEGEATTERDPNNVRPFQLESFDELGQAIGEVR